MQCFQIEETSPNVYTISSERNGETAATVTGTLESQGDNRVAKIKVTNIDMPFEIDYHYDPEGKGVVLASFTIVSILLFFYLLYIYSIYTVYICIYSYYLKILASSKNKMNVFASTATNIRLVVTRDPDGAAQSYGFAIKQHLAMKGDIIESGHEVTLIHPTRQPKARYMIVMNQNSDGPEAFVVDLKLDFNVIYFNFNFRSEIYCPAVAVQSFKLCFISAKQA